MKYLETCTATEDALNGIHLTKYNNGLIGKSSNGTYIYIPIKDSNQGNIYSKFETNGISDELMKDLIDSLISMTEDIVNLCIPLTQNQIDCIKHIIKSNPPKSAICIEKDPIEEKILGQYRSGNNYSIRFESKEICDINGQNNAINVLSIITSAFYNVIDSLVKQID